MIKKTLEISTDGAYLSCKNKQLLIKREGVDHVSIPCEDINMVLLDAPNSLISYGALTQLLENNASFLVCGKNHMPMGLLMPFSSHNQVLSRIQNQIQCNKPTHKKLWKTLIQKKISAQGELLNKRSPEYTRMQYLAKDVKSGDPQNNEAQAARIYWKHWLPDEFFFQRDSDGDGINGLLNYGYAVYRATISRACVIAGLLPALGIHHHNRSNAFCLADDLIEPFRPMVDSRVRALVLKSQAELNPKTITINKRINTILLSTSEEIFLPSLSFNSVKVNYKNNIIYINDKPILFGDIMCINGIIHVVENI